MSTSRDFLRKYCRCIHVYQFDYADSFAYNSIIKNERMDRSGSATQTVAESGKIMYPWLIEPVINVVVGAKNVTEEDEEAVNAVHYMLKRGKLTATSVPKKYPYGNGKFVLYMESGASIEKLEAAFALLDQVYIKEKESHSCQK